jgi:sulfur-oxidizing protein SoxY
MEGLRRRNFLKLSALVTAVLAGEGLTGWLRRLRAAALPVHGGEDPDPPNETVARLIHDCVGDREIKRGHVVLDMPDLAEDGRIVPVEINSDLPVAGDAYVKAVYLIVDFNPDPLVGAYHFSPANGPVALTTRIKMRRTSWIRAIVESSTGEVWADYKKVETTLNGCG